MKSAVPKELYLQKLMATTKINGGFDGDRVSCEIVWNLGSEKYQHDIKTLEMQENLFACFIDCTKRFDKVKHEEILKKKY